MTYNQYNGYYESDFEVVLAYLAHINNGDVAYNYTFGGLGDRSLQATYDNLVTWGSNPISKPNWATQIQANFKAAYDWYIVNYDSNIFDYVRWWTNFNPEAQNISTEVVSLRTAVNGLGSGYTNEMAQDAIGAALTADFIYNDAANTIGLRARSFTNNASRSLTTSTGAAGFQVSSTRDAAVNYNVTSSTTATIGGASSITVVLEIAPTNSATAGDWVEISRFSNGQTITLAIALQSVQTGAGNLGGIIPAGYYAKLRTITSGTASATYNTGQEVLL